MWASAIFSLIKSVPLIHEIYMDVSAKYDAWMQSKMESESNDTREEREALLDQLRTATSIEQRRELRRKLYELQAKN